MGDSKPNKKAVTEVSTPDNGPIILFPSRKSFLDPYSKYKPHFLNVKNSSSLFESEYPF
jgi:hypothetical protein